MEREREREREREKERYYLVASAAAMDPVTSPPETNYRSGNCVNKLI